MAIAFLAAAAWRIEPIQQQRAANDFEPLNPYTDSDVASEFRLPLPALFPAFAFALALRILVKGFACPVPCPVYAHVLIL